MPPEAQHTLDCKGLSCPMPMVKLAKAMKKIPGGETLAMEGTDPGTKSDIPEWCERKGLELLETTESGGVFTFYIRK